VGRLVQKRTLDRNAQADLVKLDRRFARFESGGAGGVLGGNLRRGLQHDESESASTIDDSVCMARMQAGEV
jgi:hypothetical protein